MNWRDEYRKKVCFPEEAVKKIKSDSRVVICHAAGEPQTLVDAMVHNYMEYKNVEIVHMVALGKCEYMKPEMEGHFRHNGLFLGGGTRDVINAGNGDYTTSFFFEIPKLFKKGGTLPVDIALIQVSPPDEHGYCSMGITCDYTKAAAENAKCVIAQVNKFMPRVLGDNFIHISEIDVIVEKDEPIIILNPPKIGDIERKIGEYCASLINDGDTLQLGIGAIPDAVLTFLKNKKDLGIHSEMISDGVVELVEAGVINNSKKTLHKGKSIVSFLMGTRKLYDYVDDNPSVEIHPVDYVNDPRVISKNENIVSINSAIQVDLMGQVNAETIGTKQFSGTGGQVDFVRGTAFALNGKSIIAVPSTASKGKVSRITAYLDEGAAVTTSRNDVQYIITEYGIADLKGKTLRERAKELIKIAHPNFREELTQEALKKFKTI